MVESGKPFSSTERLIFFIAAMISSLVLAGCLALPIPTGEDIILDGTPVTEEQLAFLRVGVTSRDEVTSRLGNPSVYWENARLFAYNWKMRSGILVWVVGGGYQAAAGMFDIPVYYALLIQFDDQDRICRFQKAKRPLYKQYGDFLQDWVQEAKKPKKDENRPKQEK